MKLFRLFCLFLLLSGVVLATNPGKDLFIPAGARATGAFGTFWQTDLRIFNTENSSCSVTIYYLPRATFASHATSTVVSLGAHEIRVYENVLENLFGITDNTAGGFRLTSSCNIMAESRTWTPAPEGSTGTYGQRIPGIPKDHEIRAGETSNVLYIDNVADFRTNFGMIETSGNGSSVTLHLYDGTGTHIGQQDVTLAGYEMRQIDGILSTFGASGSNYRVALQVNSGSVIPYASQVDNNSGDPIYIDGSVARQGGGNGGGGEVVCGDGKYFGYLVQTNNGDWEGFINAPLNVTVDNWNLIGWDEDDMGIVYITPSNYVILLGYGGTFDTPIPLSDGQPFNISYTLEYSSSGKKVLQGDYVITGTLNCNYWTGTITATIKALDPAFKNYAGKFYWNYEAGLQ